MPRHDDDSSVEDEPIRKTTKKKGGFPLWGWFAIGGGVLLMLCGGASVAGYFVVKGMAKKPEAGPRAEATVTTPRLTAPTPVGKVWDEDEVRKALLGKSPKQAVAMLGTPDSMKDVRKNHVVTDLYSPRYTDYLHIEYKDRIRNAITGKVDNCTLVFEEEVFQRIIRQ